MYGKGRGIYSPRKLATRGGGIIFPKNQKRGKKMAYQKKKRKRKNGKEKREKKGGRKWQKMGKN